MKYSNLSEFYSFDKSISNNSFFKLSFINWYLIQKSAQQGKQYVKINPQIYIEHVKNLVNELKNTIQNKEISQSEVDAMFFNTNLMDVKLEDYIDEYLLTSDATEESDRGQILSTADLKKYYNVQATKSLTKEQVLNDLAE